MRLLFAGTPLTAVPALDALAASRHEIIGVLTRPDAPAGRGRHLLRSPVAQWADERDLPVLQPARLSEPDALQVIRDLAPDCAPVVAYGALIPPDALAIPPRGWVNLHFSVLPAWRGAAPVQAALLAGDEVTGATTFALDAGLDTGPIYGLLTETIRPEDTAGTLLERLAHAGAGLLVATLDGIEDGALEARPQSPDGVSLAPKITADDAHLDFSHPATALERRTRACTPEPGAWSRFRGERIGIGPARLDPSPPAGPDPLAPGELSAGKHEVRVGAVGGSLVLGEVRPAGRRPMSAADWARGVRPRPEDRLR